MPYAAHLGCLSLDPTIIGGTLCHSAAVIDQVAANYIASEDYNDCLENQKDEKKRRVFHFNYDFFSGCSYINTK